MNNMSASITLSASTTGSFIPVAAHELSEKGRVLFTTLDGDISGFAESPVHGTHERVLSAQDAAICEDSASIAPYLVANLPDSL
jgi:hypothetical protein